MPEQLSSVSFAGFLLIVNNIRTDRRGIEASAHVSLIKNAHRNTTEN